MAGNWIECDSAYQEAMATVNWQEETIRLFTKDYMVADSLLTVRTEGIQNAEGKADLLKGKYENQVLLTGVAKQQTKTWKRVAIGAIFGLAVMIYAFLRASTI